MDRGEQYFPSRDLDCTIKLGYPWSSLCELAIMPLIERRRP